jgi:CelD/BcsL family acetyltransferase involved in cellulose biosynthesis
MREAAAAGALRLWRLYEDGRPLAVQYWIVWRGLATVHKLAHAEAARALSPGTLLTALAIRDLLAEGVAVLDFGRGDDEYKRLWAGARRQRIGWLVCDPRRPAGIVEIARHLGGVVRRLPAAARGQNATTTGT